MSARRAEGRQETQKGKSEMAGGEPQRWGGIGIQRKKKESEAGENKRVEKKSERLCDSGAAEQQATERRKSRFELIFVEEVNMIVQGPLFKHSGSCGGAGQVTDHQCVTGPSLQGPEKSESSDAPDYI